MRECHAKIRNEGDEAQLFGGCIPPISALPQQYAPELVGVLEHFCGRWLSSMGYRT